MPYYPDPRPDLIKDTELWQQLLTNCANLDRDLFLLFRGLRAGGANLEKYKIKPNNDNTLVQSLRLNPGEHEQEFWDNEVKPNWLIPNTEKIKQMFDLTAMGVIDEDFDMSKVPKEWQEEG